MKCKKVIALKEDKLGGKVVTKFVELRPNQYSNLTHNTKTKSRNDNKRTKKV